MMPRRTARVCAPPQVLGIKEETHLQSISCDGSDARPEKPLCFNGCALIPLGAGQPLLDLTFKGNQKSSSYDHRQLSWAMQIPAPLSPCCAESLIDITYEQLYSG
jgi:hypothetical protein